MCYHMCDHHDDGGADDDDDDDDNDDDENCDYVCGAVQLFPLVLEEAFQKTTGFFGGIHEFKYIYNGGACVYHVFAYLAFPLPSWPKWE